MKKHLLYAAMFLTLSAGAFTACSNDDSNVKPNSGVTSKASTTMSIAFALPTPTATRAASDGQDDPAGPKFNNKGTWLGQDKIESVEVFIFAKDPVTVGDSKLELHETLTASQLQLEQPATSPGIPNTQSYIRPKKAFQVAPGDKIVYVVVNPTADVTNYFNADAASLTLGAATGWNVVGTTQLYQFQARIATSEFKFNNPTVLTSGGPTVKTRADEIAKVDGTGTTADRDVIVMTGNTAGTGTIADNVKEAETLRTSSPLNRINLEVQRTTARVLLTSKAASYTILGDDPAIAGVSTTDPIATISNLKYVVAQGESSFFFTQQASADPTNYAFKTPNSTWVPTNAPVGSTTTPPTPDPLDYNQNAGDKYDYSGLWKKYDGTTFTGGLDVSTWAAYSAAVTSTDVAGEVANATGLHGEFILPNTHKFDANPNVSEYKKGNTAYILVRAKLTPTSIVTKSGGTRSVVAYSTWDPTGNKDFYLGDDGFFYDTAENAADDAITGHTGSATQKVKKFIQGKVIYTVWINPDEVLNSKWVNSPVIRNNIYHVNIGTITQIGENWNPLVPNKPHGINPGPISPTNPLDPRNPNNPDDQIFIPTNPGNPISPTNPPVVPPNTPINPVKPEDPLSFKDTYMSVGVSILPWQVHSVEVNL